MDIDVSFAKEIYTFKEPTDRSHPISIGSERMHMDVSFISHSIKCEPTNIDRHSHRDTQSLTLTHTQTHTQTHTNNCTKQIDMARQKEANANPHKDRRKRQR